MKKHSKGCRSSLLQNMESLVGFSTGLNIFSLNAHKVKSLPNANWTWMKIKNSFKSNIFLEIKEKILNRISISSRYGRKVDWVIKLSFINWWFWRKHSILYLKLWLYDVYLQNIYLYIDRMIYILFVVQKQFFIKYLWTWCCSYF